MSQRGQYSVKYCGSTDIRAHQCSLLTQNLSTSSFLSLWFQPLHVTNAWGSSISLNFNFRGFSKPRNLRISIPWTHDLDSEPNSLST